MAGVLQRTIFITRDDNTVVQLNAGSEVPKEFEKLLASHRHVVEAGSSASAPAVGSGESVEDEPNAAGDGYDALGYPELKALVKERELPPDGKIADLIARLREDDAEKAAVGSGESVEDEPNAEHQSEE